MPDTLTVEYLLSHGACRDEVALFAARWPDGLRLEGECPTGIPSGWVDWSTELLPAPALAEYHRVRSLALAEYHRVTAPALAEFDRVRSPALAEYPRVRSPALAEYPRVTALAWDEYQRLKALAWAEYHRVKALTIWRLLSRTGWTQRTGSR